MHNDGGIPQDLCFHDFAVQIFFDPNMLTTYSRTWDLANTHTKIYIYIHTYNYIYIYILYTYDDIHQNMRMSTRNSGSSYGM